MPRSKCPACAATKFELSSTDGKIEEARFKHFFVQCATCGAVVGIIDYINPHVDAEAIGTAIDKLKLAVERVAHDVSSLATKVRHL